VRVVDYDKAGLVIVPIHEIGGLIACRSLSIDGRR